MNNTQFRTIFARLSQVCVSSVKKRGRSKIFFFAPMLFEKGTQAFRELVIGLPTKNLSLCCQKIGGVYITLRLGSFCVECAESIGIVFCMRFEDAMLKCSITARHGGPDVWLLFAVPPSHESSGLDCPWQGKICPHQRLLHDARAASLRPQTHLLQR